jgi:hypothetical protein
LRLAIGPSRRRVGRNDARHPQAIGEGECRHERQERPGKHLAGQSQVAGERPHDSNRPFVVNTLREWRLVNSHTLVFANRNGNVEDRGNVLARLLWPTMRRAGHTDAAGEPKYKGLHALRHFYAS